MRPGFGGGVAWGCAAWKLLWGEGVLDRFLVQSLGSAPIWLSSVTNKTERCWAAGERERGGRARRCIRGWIYIVTIQGCPGQEQAAHKPAGSGSSGGKHKKSLPSCQSSIFSPILLGHTGIGCTAVHRNYSIKKQRLLVKISHRRDVWWSFALEQQGLFSSITALPCLQEAFSGLTCCGVF